MFFKQLLILGGIYFILSFFLGLIPKFPDGILFICLCLAIITLMIKKSFVLLNRLSENYPKITNYLFAFGLTQYISFLLLGIPAVFEGYKVAQAEYYHLEYQARFDAYQFWALSACLGILVISCIWATYQNFIKETH